MLYQMLLWRVHLCRLFDDTKQHDGSETMFHIFSNRFNEDIDRLLMNTFHPIYGIVNI